MRCSDGFTGPPRARAIVATLEGQQGQGIEYVGLILLVSLLMVGMVAAMKGFNGKQGTELAEVIVGLIGGERDHVQVMRGALPPAPTLIRARWGRAGGSAEPRQRSSRRCGRRAGR